MKGNKHTYTHTAIKQSKYSSYSELARAPDCKTIVFIIEGTWVELACDEEKSMDELNTKQEEEDTK